MIDAAFNGFKVRGAVAAAAVALLLGLAPAAEAGKPSGVGERVIAPTSSPRVKVHRFRAVSVRRRSVVFRVRGLDPSRVTGVSVVLYRKARARQHRRVRRRVGLKRARWQVRRGRLRVRVGRGHRYRRSGRRSVAIVRTVRSTRRIGSCGGLLSPRNWPAGCWRPYSDESPFNRRLPASPKLSPDSGDVVDRMTGWGEAQPLLAGHPRGNDSDYGHPIYYASADDPLYTVRCVMWRSSCEVDGMQVRIPADARPASGGDGHMAVIDPVGGWEYDFWQVRTDPPPAGGGTINVSHGGRTAWGTADADGLGSNATAAHFGLDAGVIRAEEWAAATANGGGIDHALFIAVKCSGGDSVYPAAAGTSAASCGSFGSPNRNAPLLGSHFYLDLSDGEINDLRVPAWKKPILKAMAHYGMFVGDTYANNDWSFGLMTESDAQYRALGEAGRYAALGKRWDADTYKGAFIFDIDSGVNWSRHLKLLAPCVSHGSC